MSALMNEAQEINSVAVNRIVNIERKRRCAATRKTVGADMVAALPFDNLPGLSGDAFKKCAGQSLGN